MAAKKKKKAKKKAPARRKAGKRDVLCVGSKVKAYVKSQGMKSSGDLIQAVSDNIHSMLDSAISRTQGNKRSTVRPHDM